MSDLSIAAKLDESLSALSASLDAKLEAQNANNGKATEAVRADMKVMAQDFEQMKNELNDSMTAIEQKGMAGVGSQDKTLSMGESFVGSDEFQSFHQGSSGRARFTFQGNTIVEGTDNTVTRHDQLPGVVDGPFRQLTVLPTVQRGQTTSNVVYYSRELAWTNNAAETAENTTKPESDLTFEEVTENVRTIPHFIKVSKQALDDSTFLASYIDRRMSHGVRQHIESQIINGDGTGVNLSGWLATGNSVATDPLLTTDFYGLANKMKYEIISADYTPDYFYVNPTDWANAETIRRGTGDAAFVAASGAVSYVNNGLTPLLWGLPVVASNAVPAGTLICKSQDADMYISRNETVVEMFEQDGTNVQSNLVTVRAEARGAEAVMIPAAIRTGAIGSIT